MHKSKRFQVEEGENQGDQEKVEKRGRFFLYTLVLFTF